jgi:class 3 adenylate cyclase/predicted ATPase
VGNLLKQAVTVSPGAAEGERKTITALFADLKGSTALIEDLDPEEARRIIDPALQLMMDAVHQYDGYVAQPLGDGIFALFGAPVAHEDHPQRALYAALKMQEEMRRYAEQLRRQGGVPLQLRVGVNTGEVVARSVRKDDLHADYVPVGHAINLAARMETLATPGSIVVSEQTHRLTEGYFQFKALGLTQVKGVSEPLNIYEVLGVGPLRTRLQVAAKRGLVRFVGRQRELEQMRRALELTTAGYGQIVGVMGEPGVGKSRLFHEFVGIYGHTPLLVLRTFAVSYGQAFPYLPLIDLLKNYFQIVPSDDERKRREKIAGKVLMLDRALEDTLPYLFTLLNMAEPESAIAQMDAQIRKRWTSEAMKRIFVRESLNQPLVIIVEDLHWLDAETQAFLLLLSESVATAKILLLTNYRPEYRHEWGNKSFFSQIRLDPLRQEDAQEMLDALLTERVGMLREAPLQDLKRFILAKTDGNPFFMEEIVQALHEQGMLSGVGEGEQTLPREGAARNALSELRLPATVQGILASRIDHLPSAEKELLQTLAVIGREFSFSLLAQVVSYSHDELHRLLSRLQTAEFIYEQPTFPDVEYTFKHVLTQEVAYNSLLIERRKTIHERVAQASEGLYHAKLEDHYSELAHHYSQSGNRQKAVKYLYLIGQQAAQRSAYAEAISHLTSALQLLRTLSDTPDNLQQELDVQLALAASLQVTKGPSSPEVEHAYTRARELLQQKGEASQLFSVLRGLWVLHHVRANLATARELGEQLRVIAEQAQDAALLLEAHRSLGSTLLWQGEFPLARIHLEQAMACYAPHLHRSLTLRYGGADPGVSCLCEIARVLWFLGYPDQALRRSQEALTLAQNLSDPFSLGYALVFAAGLHQLRREGKATRQRAEEGIALARERGFASLLSAGTIRRGWAIAEQGQAEEGLLQMQQGLTARQTTGAELAQPYFLALQAEIYGKLGKNEQAVTLLSEALIAMSTSEEHRLEAELYRLKGELTLQQASQKAKVKAQKSIVPNPKSQILNPNSEAEACFLKAIEIARKQQAKSLELRAVMSLARLRQQQAQEHASRNTHHAPSNTDHASRSRLDEAYSMLSDVYNWFTEGFDTADLQEAKALLEEPR